MLAALLHVGVDPLEWAMGMSDDVYEDQHCPGLHALGQGRVELQPVRLSSGARFVANVTEDVQIDLKNLVGAMSRC